MLIYFCSSSHGFGHAARDAAVLQQVRRLRPEWTLVMSSGLPSPVLNLLLGDAAIEQRSCQWDVGMVQADALGVDCVTTLRVLDELEQRLPTLIEAEALWIASQGQPVFDHRGHSPGRSRPGPAPRYTSGVDEQFRVG